ncbi:curved DNA-binding protein [Providencia sp.]
MNSIQQISERDMAMELKDYYSIMGVKRTDDLKTIKTAYRRLARKYHPDVSKEPDAEAKFKEIAEAWAVLSDTEKRAQYDEMWEHRNDPYFNQGNQGHGYSQQGQGYGQQGFDAGGFDDIFSSMFSQRARGGSTRQPRSQRGHDLEVELAVFLEESQESHKRTISYNLPVYNAFGFIENEVPKTLNVTIPAGVIDGQRIRLKGQGTAGENGGENGDLWITIRIAPHPLFDIKGHDLEVVVPLTPWEAALGTKVTIPTLKDPIVITVPANSQAGQKLRLKGKGLMHKGHTGDLYAIIKIVMPDSNNAESNELWQKLAETQQSFDPRKNWGGK